jgi:transcriptional regulator with GAF, ATPase, and Fis domain
VTRRLTGSLTALALTGGPLAITVSRATAAQARAPEVRRARDAGADALVVLPLRDAEGTLGYAALASGPATPAIPLSPALLDALARVLTGALRQVQLLGRVAAVSRRAHGDARELRGELDRVVLPREIVAASPAMRAILHEVVPLVARQDTTVLVRGETGTGKEVVARRIHALSRRAGRPFLAVNCGALPEGLVESALFGHERGAFTGAAARRAGYFERAHGGVLLLDEIAELPRFAQVRLLRVLQEGEIERVGGESTVRVDVRVIAATHRPLEAMVAEGTFREDLYYRLQVFPIVIPPLRERPEDVEALARAMVEVLAARFERAPPRLTAAAMEGLLAHGWPGNVRELWNVIERAMVLSTGSELALPSIASPAPRGAPAAPREARVPTYREAMKRCIEEALGSCGGKIYGEDGAAAALALKPTTLQSKMKKLGIRRVTRSDGRH